MVKYRLQWQYHVAKHTFKLAIIQVTSSYCATLSPQLPRINLRGGGLVETLATASKSL